MKLRLTILGLTLLGIIAFTAGAYVYYRAMKTAVLADADMRMASTAGPSLPAWLPRCLKI